MRVPSRGLSGFTSGNKIVYSLYLHTFFQAIPSPKQQSEAVQHILEINANLLIFAKNLVAPASVGAAAGRGAFSNSKYARTIFAPSLNEGFERNDMFGET